MSSKRHGMPIFGSEVTNIASTGFWVLVDNIEYFVPFSDYPVFKRATVEQIFGMQQIAPGHLHWPELDADVELDALEHPEKYPLVWQDKP